MSSTRRAAPRDLPVGVVSLGPRLGVIDRGHEILIQITAESGVTLTSLLHRSAGARGSGGRGVGVGRAGGTRGLSKFPRRVD